MEYADKGWSREKVIDRLQEEDIRGPGFTKEEAEYAADYYGLK